MKVISNKVKGVPGRMKKDKELLDALVEFANEGIIVSDMTGTIVLANPKANKLFELPDLVGKKIEELIPNKHRSSHVGLREGYQKNPHSREMGKGMELFAQASSGREFPVEISLSHFKTHDGAYVMSFVIDVTDRKKGEKELVIALAQLQTTSEALSSLNKDLESKVHERTEELAHAIRNLAESKRDVLKALEREKTLNELKSRFVTMASHEFRTPLGTILSSVSLISRYEKIEDVEKRQKHVLRIKSAVQNLTEILNDFLSLDKLEEGVVRVTPGEIEITEFLDEVVEELRMIVKQGQTIVTQHLKGKLKVSTDKQILKNIMNNLISNAIKYSPENSQIMIRTEADPRYFFISVIDKGMGIPDADQPFIFERFFRAHNSTNIQGTGLGLNIVHKYTELLDGTVSFQSQADLGTTFKLSIPILQ